jgi:hypothetical protein
LWLKYGCFVNDDDDDKEAGDKSQRNMICRCILDPREPEISTGVFL